MLEFIGVVVVGVVLNIAGHAFDGLTHTDGFFVFGAGMVFGMLLLWYMVKD